MRWYLTVYLSLWSSSSSSGSRLACLAQSLFPWEQVREVRSRFVEVVVAAAVVEQVACPEREGPTLAALRTRQGTPVPK